ncbi:MAG: hypothetical protein Fur005_40610 [Roseiflexaceae bacterium]
MPDDTFDAQAYLQAQLGSTASNPQIEVKFQLPLPIVQQKIPASAGTLSATESGTLFRCPYRNIGSMARYLIGLNLPFVVQQPPELREALVQIAQEITHSATAHLQAP